MWYKGMQIIVNILRIFFSGMSSSGKPLLMFARFYIHFSIMMQGKLS
jgi:hypothetical protein